MENLYKETISNLHNGDFDKVSVKIAGILKNRNEDPKWKVAFASLYLDIAECWKIDSGKFEDSNLLISKTLQIYNKYESQVENPLFFKKNRARALGLRYDINYTKYQLETNNLECQDFSNIKTVYSIEDCLGDAIKLYRESLKEIEGEFQTKNDIYNCRNNLAQHLSRTGRFVEALDFFEENIKMSPERWESLASYGDILHSFTESSLLPSTVSLHLNICEAYLKAIENKPHQNALPIINHHLNKNTAILSSYDCELNQDIIHKNRKEEYEEYSSLNEFRKFVLKNLLSLNEHSIYCKCKDSRIDNLKIGHLSGSKHLHHKNAIGLLDGYVNRILSEFGYSRFLYFNHVSGISITPNDIEFSDISVNMDELGYEIEQLRSSYRLIYGVLDKIMNGILVLYDLERNNEDYFESFFFQKKSELESKNNIHLAALFSMALDLDQGNGIFRHFKKIRNKMEHDYMPINNSEENSISLIELEKFTFELLKLARSAIFSFVFLIRTETIFEIEVTNR